MYKLEVPSWVLVFTSILQLSSTHPFILDTVVNGCSYNLSNREDGVPFISDTMKVETSDVTIYYTFCGHLPEDLNCGPNVAVCLKDKKSKSIRILGKSLNLDNQFGSDLSFRAVNGESCLKNSKKKYSVSFIFKCDQEIRIKEPNLEKKSDCEYNIYITVPTKCSLNCITKVNDRIIDLRELKGNYNVESKQANFSLALCGAKPTCYYNSVNDISVCKRDAGGTLPLSSYKNERVIYNQKKNELVYRGSYKGEHGGKKIEIILKCKWETTAGNIKHLELPIQGKEYKFVMDTSFGCIKLPPKCVVEEGMLIYNLTNLFNANGYQVKNFSNGRLYLNICGYSNFGQKSENSCSRSLSQVCEVSSDGSYVNKGSIASELKILNDNVIVAYNYGMTCKEDSSRQYRTYVNLSCSKLDSGPIFVKDDKCDLFINWKTPQACPTFNKSSLGYTEENHDCSVNYQGQLYDFNALRLNKKSYEVPDPQSKTIKYFLNVCSFVFDTDSPLVKNSMIIMKDMDESNVKYRTKSLGKMDEISVDNEQFVIKAKYGTYCGLYGDYNSYVTLVCDQKEQTPQFVSKTNCTYQFQWKTPLACIKKMQANKEQCLIKGRDGNISLDFSKSGKNSLKINIGEWHYLFHFCKDDYTECLSNGRCKTLLLRKNLTSNNGTVFLELSLPTVCNKGNINKVKFELVCDTAQFNEHFKLKNQQQIDNCTVNLFLYSNLVCGAEEYQIEGKKENVIYNVQSDNLPTTHENVITCAVSNSITGYKLNLSSLHLNIPIDVCPTSIFYEHNSSVVLIYPSTIICSKPSTNAKFEYKAILTCSDQEFRDIKIMDCFELHFLKGPSICNLFETTTLQGPSKTKAAMIVCSTIFGIIILIAICVFGFYNLRKHLRSRSHLAEFEEESNVFKID